MAHGVTDKNTFTLWALYDSMPHQRGVSSIFLTEKGRWADEILLAHEIAHYWYEQFCSAPRGPGTEAFAKAFENVYQDELNRRVQEQR